MVTTKQVRFNLSSLSNQEAEHDEHALTHHPSSSLHKPQLSARPCLKKSLQPSLRAAAGPQVNTQTAEAEGPPSARKLRQETLNHLKCQLGKKALQPDDLLYPPDQSTPAHAEPEQQLHDQHFEEEDLAPTNSRNAQLPQYPYPNKESEAKSKRPDKNMTEPRARAARHKGQLNFPSELKSFLHAFGDNTPPLPETVRVLDEIVTDFIIETCHNAARSAQICKRQKIKLEDFNFAVRGSEVMLGRVREMLATDKTMKEMRRQFDTEEGKIGLERGGRKRKAGDGDEEEKVEKVAKKKVKGEEEGEK